MDNNPSISPPPLIGYNNHRFIKAPPNSMPAFVHATEELMHQISRVHWHSIKTYLHKIA